LRWTQVLAEHPTATTAELAELTGKTANAVRRARHRHGYSHPRRKYWDDILAEHPEATEEELVKISGKSPAAVKNILHRRGLLRSREEMAIDWTPHEHLFGVWFDQDIADLVGCSVQHVAAVRAKKKKLAAVYSRDPTRRGRKLDITAEESEVWYRVPKATRKTLLLWGEPGLVIHTLVQRWLVSYGYLDMYGHPTPPGDRAIRLLKSVARKNDL
jgi:hypothetical protein